MKNKITKILIGLLMLTPLSVGAFSWREFWGDKDIKVEPSQNGEVQPFGNDSATIVNNVSVSASTGGNTATSGNVVTGEAKAGVKVRTEVNGEVLEDFEKEFSGDTNFEQKFEHATGTASTTTKIKVRTNNQQPTTTMATSTIATSTKVLPRHFNERVSNWFAKLFKNVFSIFKK